LPFFEEKKEIFQHRKIMTKISRRRKIASWESVKENIEEMMENVPEHTAALSLPYGMQGQL
jgi:hypothetical protein